MNNGSVSGADVELGKGTTCQPASFGCSLDDTACTEFNANLSIVTVDAALPIVDELYSSSGTVVKGSMCTEPGPRKAGGQLQRMPASNESSGTSVGVETHKTEGLTTSMTKGSSKSDDMSHGAGLNQSKNAIVGCEGMKVNESNTASYTSHCNENAQENQVAPSFKNSARVIDETEVAELVPLKESREDDNMLSCVNSNSSSITKDMLNQELFCV
jgi:general transcription factor 3C polypeptide 2